MEHKNLGSTGLRVSVVGLGCNNFGMRCDYEASKAVIDKAIESGITLFDTADIYGNQGGSEEILGKALGARRKDVIVASKFGGPMGDGELMQGGSRRYIFNAVEASLKRLGTDYLDLYQYHWPDGRTPVEETLDALNDLVREGKVRYIGSSNFSGWQVVEAEYIARAMNGTRFVSAQNQYNLLDRRPERELVPACNKYRISILPYFPLASGMLTGKYKRGEAPPPDTRLALWGEDRTKALTTERNFDIVEGLEGFARERNRSLLDLAMGWLASQPHVASVIAGATKPEQVTQNVEAGNWSLSAEELAAVDKITRR